MKNKNITAFYAVRDTSETKQSDQKLRQKYAFNRERCNENYTKTYAKNMDSEISICTSKNLLVHL